MVFMIRCGQNNVERGFNLNKNLKNQNMEASTVLQRVAGYQSLLTIWVSWSVKIDADFLK